MSTNTASTAFKDPVAASRRMNSPINVVKTKLRIKIQGMLSYSFEKQQLDSSINNQLLPLLKDFGTVSCYRSFACEVQTDGILEVLRASGKKVYLPEESGSECDAYIVPGLAFDREGWRLGRGGGFYDRLLAGARGVKIALAYDFQILPHIPHEAHDVRMDLIVTEKEIIDIAAGSR